MLQVVPTPKRLNYHKVYPGYRATGLMQDPGVKPSTQLGHASKVPGTWAGCHYLISPLVFNFGYLFYGRNSCVYSSTFLIISQYVLRTCTCWPTLRSIGQLIIQVEKLCFLVTFLKVGIRTQNQYNWLKWSLIPISLDSFSSPHHRHNIGDISAWTYHATGSIPCDPTWPAMSLCLTLIICPLHIPPVSADAP